MIDTKALREKILDLAIRGKLVPQDPNDEPASVLLERIRAQKQQMVKEGKLKAKDIKNDTIIFKGEDNLHYEQFRDGTVKCIEDEIPFDAPDGWAWCRLKDLFNVCSAKRVLQSDWQKDGIPFYRAREIVKLSNNGYVDNDLFISLEHYETLKQSYGVPQVGDLMVTGVGTIGKVYIVQENDTFYYKDASVLCFENRYGAIESEYARIMIDSPFLQEQIHLKTYGNTVDTITISTANAYLCILPPISEQRKIIETVKNILEIAAIIEDGYDGLQSSITQAKSKILDLAIRGKLVPQDPNDEPASLLLERIKAEKEELIKQGKIKRDKKESVIFKGEDNSYYQDLPENWELVTFSNIANLISGRDLKPEEYNSDRIGIPYITGASNFNKGAILINRWTTSPKSISIKNDILLSCKGTVGELAINDHDKIHIARQIMAIRVSTKINLEYIKLFFESMILEIKKSADGLIPGISRDDILSLNIPLPPLAEQNRIVKTIETVFLQLDEITNAIA